MAVTIKDIAKKAGVSYSTVSRALNDQNADKSDKKKRILRIAKAESDLLRIALPCSISSFLFR